MIIAEPKPKRKNRTIVLPLGPTLKEYNALISTEDGMKQLIRRVELADRLRWGHLADGHKPGCFRRHRFTHHHDYLRWLKHYAGIRSRVCIVRVRCLDCNAVFTVLPAFVVRYKRYDTDAMEKLMVQLFITEGSYRMAGVSQALAIDTAQSGTWAALEATSEEAIRPMVLWRLVQWVGQLSPAQLNLALGVEPPQYILADEKHTRQNGERTYVPMIYEFQVALIWWIDYLDSVSEEALRASFERFKGLDDRLSHILGATVDGWEPTQNALLAAFQGITLAECHFHALIKLGTHLATYKRERKAAGQPVLEVEERCIRAAFVRVLEAPTPEAYEQALEQLPEAFHAEPLASRKHSLEIKQLLFQAWTTDEKLARTSTALDQCMRFLNRKQDNMQTFRTDSSASCTLNAWALTRNCWRFLAGAKRAGQSPLELAGACFHHIPWMQWVNLALCAFSTLALSAGAVELLLST